MAITLADNTATISTTELSLPANASYSSGSPQTNDCVMQAWVDPAAMAAGDTFRIRVYEKVNGGTQRVAYEAVLVGAQSSLFVFPSLIVGDGWDVTIVKVAGTDRSMRWSIRQVA